MYDEDVVMGLLEDEIQDLKEENDELKKELQTIINETKRRIKEQTTTDEIDRIELVLENCEVIIIDGKYIGAFYINNIKTNISRIAINSVQKYSTSGDILIEILKGGNVKYLPFNIEDYKTTVFDRLTEANDITHVEVHWKDGSCDDIWVEYNDESHSTFENTYQQSYLSEIGNLYISINKNDDIFDIIDKERVDQESYGKQ